ncbi:MAG: hypothetical protein ACRDRK_07585 [Pseudonocardia sp.]
MSRSFDIQAFIDALDSDLGQTPDEIDDIGFGSGSNQADAIDHDFGDGADADGVRVDGPSAANGFGDDASQSFHRESERHLDHGSDQDPDNDQDADADLDFTPFT